MTTRCPRCGAPEIRLRGSRLASHRDYRDKSPKPNCRASGRRLEHAMSTARAFRGGTLLLPGESFEALISAAVKCSGAIASLRYDGEAVRIRWKRGAVAGKEYVWRCGSSGWGLLRRAWGQVAHERLVEGRRPSLGAAVNRWRSYPSIRAAADPNQGLGDDPGSEEILFRGLRELAGRRR